MDPLSSAIGLGVGLIGTVGGMFASGKRNRQLSELEHADPMYQANPLAAQRLGYARQLLNARSPGAAAAERNIYSNQANTSAAVTRSATDSSQALAMASGLAGQTNQAFEQLGQQENQDYMGRLNYLGQAEQGQIGEQDKVYQDQIRRYQDKASIRGAQAANTANNWQSLSNLGFGVMNANLGGMVGGLGGGSNQTTYSDIPYQRPAAKM